MIQRDQQMLNEQTSEPMSPQVVDIVIPAYNARHEIQNPLNLPNANDNMINYIS